MGGWGINKFRDPIRFNYKKLASIVIYRPIKDEFSTLIEGETIKYDTASKNKYTSEMA